MIRMSRSVLISGLLAFSLPAFGTDSIQRLNQFITEVHSFDGQFTQTVYDENGKAIQVARGDVALEKPGKFRWQYTKPYSQLILSDGKYLWIYDEELLQATAKPITDALGNAAIMLLTNIRPLGEGFEIKQAATRAGLVWVELIPLVQDAEFHRIQIGFDENTIHKLELHDHFSQTTAIEFVDLQTNVKFPAQYFKFNVPAGVDVVGYPAN